MALMLSVSLAACERKDPKKDVKVIKTEKVLVQKEPVTVNTLDKRVTALEQRNREVDQAVVAKRKKGKFSPAPKYDPNFK